MDDEKRRASGAVAGQISDLAVDAKNARMPLHRQKRQRQQAQVECGGSVELDAGPHDDTTRTSPHETTPVVRSDIPASQSEHGGLGGGGDAMT